MAHDSSVVKLGSVGMSGADISEFATAPATNPAGFAVSLASTGAIAKTASSGMRVGVSLGRSLSNNDKTAVCRAGLKVPLRLKNYATAKITVTSYANLIDDNDDTLTIGATAFTFQSGAATPGQATIQAATSNDATATSIATQINAHATASTKVVAVASGAVVYLTAVDSGADGEDVLVEYDDVDGTGDSVGLTVTGSTLGSGATGDTLLLFVPTQGTDVYIHSVTGEAASSLDNSVVSGAVYAEAGAFTGYDEDNAEVRACLIDMPGGL